MKIIRWASDCIDSWSAGSHPAQCSCRSKSELAQHQLTEVGCCYSSCVTAPICLYLVLYFKLLLITVSQGFGLLKLSESDNGFLYREYVIYLPSFSSLLPSTSMLIPLCSPLQFYASSTSHNLFLYTLIFKGTHLCPLACLHLQHDLISL